MGQTHKNCGTFEWLDLEKPKKKELLELTAPFHIEIKLLEDSLQHGHLPKIEKQDGTTFVIIRAYSADPSHNYSEVTKLTNKIAFVVSSDRLITIHQKPFEFLDALFQKEFDDPEDLMLGILQQMLSTYQAPLDWLSDKIDEYEKEIFVNRHGKISVQALYFQKSKARISKKILQLTQNVLNQIQVNEIHFSTLQDLKETCVNLILHFDEVIEDATSILNTHLNLTSQKSNEVMKLLTIFSAFFLPLTFIVGVYGMNFENIPELKWTNGYYLALGLMALVSVLIFIWFKRKKIM
ncbi:CorA family divalent cation transporter [Algoriphagus boritolerans]|uniref:Magnesium transporter n=1 Tax=Algoriphagus boritolerans DSM 17298 = JCM 18970 TaxID=1120964 RepID=A0A1H5TKG0_9BACT|nr:CorA family divalent cation transporter [Algoriphagus boritolerans]SEF63285.1 magnesium transporter [Algoriphagus boritolerans DSM 17298 = JCM 18970]